jgi:hypothetical protein
MDRAKKFHSWPRDWHQRVDTAGHRNYGSGPDDSSRAAESQGSVTRPDIHARAAVELCGFAWSNSILGRTARDADSTPPAGGMIGVAVSGFATAAGLFGGSFYPIIWELMIGVILIALFHRCWRPLARTRTAMGQS